MKTENLSTLKINKLSKAQFERELAAGRIDENALYLTPDNGDDGDDKVINVDTTLSDTSENPVQNKVVTAAINEAKTLAESKAPAYTYGTTDLTAGSSLLAYGTLYFVYE